MDTEALQTQLQEQLAKSGGDPSSMLAGFSMWSLFFGFAFGVFGWWIFKQGRQKRHFGIIGVGIALMVYPYFIYNPWACFLVGAGLCFAAYRMW
jgi:hypothetical protein